MLLKEEKQQFDKEQDELLKVVLNERFFYPWQDDGEGETSLRNDANLEIYITNACNQKCEYCYLTKYEGLYPSDQRSPAHLLKNLQILYDFILEHNYHIPKVEFFSGEIWHTQFGLDVLDLTEKYIEKGMRVDWFLIASNCSFIFDKVQTQRIQHYINRFRELGSDLCFSASVDGKVIEQMERPSNNGAIRTDEYYEDLFAFCKHNGYGFHPMVASQSVKYWIENHKWWEEQFKKWDMDIFNLMMLEVRNADWTDESIKAYCDFMDYLIDKYLNDRCHGDKILFANCLAHIRNQQGIELGGYVPWAFPETDTFAGCTVATDLTVRVGDLAICPCHRTAYNKYLYGKFVVENDKIVDIEANNPQMAIKILMTNFETCINGCDKCEFNQYCLKGCYGSQLETMGDPFIPIPNVCKFFKAKNGHLLQKYKEMGIIDYLKTVTPYEYGYDKIKKFLNMVKGWEKKNVEKY